MAKSKHSRSEDSANDEGPRTELDFERGDERGGRAGDRRWRDDLDQQFPDERVREAGLSGAASLGGEPTADDLAPETLLHEERADAIDGMGGTSAADVSLREVDASQIGGGSGSDEAGLAQDKPDDDDESPASSRRPVSGNRHAK